MTVHEVCRLLGVGILMSLSAMLTAILGLFIKTGVPGHLLPSNATGR